MGYCHIVLMRRLILNNSSVLERQLFFPESTRKLKLTVGIMRIHTNRRKLKKNKKFCFGRVMAFFLLFVPLTLQ